MLTWIQDSTLWVVMNAFGKGFGDYKEGMSIYSLTSIIFFSSGIYDEPTCPKTDGNHAVKSNRFFIFIYLLITLLFRCKLLVMVSKVVNLTGYAKIAGVSIDLE